MEMTICRAPLTTEFSFRRADEDGAFVETLPVHADIDEGGVFVPTDRFLPAEAFVELIFRIPTRTMPLQATGRVAWSGTRSKGTGMGVEFRGLEPSARLEIHRFAVRGEWSRGTQQ